MEALMLRTVETLRSHAGWFDTEFKDSLNWTARTIAENSKKPGGVEDADADKYFRLLHLAMENRGVKCRAAALEAIKKLIESGYLRGASRVVMNGVERFLVDIIIEAVCSVRDDQSEDVQLKAVSVLVTAVKSSTCLVREQSLLLAVRGVYHVFLVSRSAVVKTACKANLREMLQAVFDRMEKAVAAKAEAPAPSSPPAEAAPAPTPQAAVAAPVPLIPADAVTVPLPAAPFTVYMYPSVAVQLGFKFAPTPAAATAATPTTASISTAAPSAAAAPVAAASEAPGAFHPASTSPDAVDLNGFSTPFHRDAFLLFRALCRLSMKGDEDPLLPEGAMHLPGAGPTPPTPAAAGGAAPGAPGGAVVPILSDDALQADPIALQSKLLALDLILGLLEAAGPSFRTSSRFIAAIKTYLCKGLLTNLVSTIPAAASVSLKVFLALMRGWKAHIAGEVEVFISTIFLRLLTAAHSTFEQKSNVLAAFRTIAADPASILEIFLNYDCADGRENLFENSVLTLASIAQGRASDEFNASQKTAAEAATIRNAAMQALAAIVQSLVVITDKSAGLVAPGPAAAAATAAPTAGDVPSSEPASAAGEDASTIAVPSMASPGGPSSTTSASAALARGYEEQKRRRAVMEKAVLKFRVKPKAGITYMQENGMCTEAPESIAAVFHELRDLLDKTAMGDFMGEDKAINVSTMHAYVDQLNFAGMQYDAALRLFLSGFRLPGEGQKIDRMMEKFAERYCTCNPGVFPTADCAFILAFSMIMLQTDAHSPSIKADRKMTKPAFVNMNRGIAAGGDLPPEFLGTLYDAIVSTPITLREDEERRARVQASRADEKSRKALQQAERAEIVKAGAAAMTTVRRSAAAAAAAAVAAAADTPEDASAPAAPSGSEYYTIDDVDMSDHVSPMFDLVWGPLLAVFGVVLETTGDDDPRTINAVLIGFAQAVHIAGVLNMTLPRDAMVAALCKFTHLEPGAGVREMKAKNIACMRALLNIAINEADRLGAAWGPVLVCVSEVARLLNVAAGGKDDSTFFAPARKGAAAAAGGARRDGGAPAHRAEVDRLARAHERDATVARINATLVAAAVDEADVTRVYTRSVNLSDAAIVDFVTQLAAVSLQELASVLTPPSDFPGIGASAAPSNNSGGGAGYGYTHAGATLIYPTPRIFSLQKVVEVADFNMNTRPRMTWTRVWDTLSSYFTSVCCSPTASVAFFAIDSLKQLSTKFLEKPELRSFHFQTKFLQPFLTLMQSTSEAATAVTKPRAGARRPGGAAPPAMTPTAEIRELILHVCANLIRARAGNIRSGWRTFMGVYAAAAHDADELLVSMAFSTIHEVLTTHFDAVAGAGAFVDAVHCMIAFGGNPHALFALRAVDHVATLGVLLARGRVPLTEEAVDEYGTGAAAGARVRVASVTERNTNASGQDTSDDALWYDLDGAVNGDVRESEARMRVMDAAAEAREGGDAASRPPRADVPHAHEGEDDHAHGGNIDGVDGGEDVMANEVATDAALLAADPEAGGRIRRFDDTRIHLQLWWPLLTGLAGLVTADARAPVRIRALHAMFALLRRYGPGFAPSLWALVYSGVLLPMFDDVRHAGDASDAPAPAAAARGDLEASGSAPPRYSLHDFMSKSIPTPVPILPNAHRGAGGDAAAWPLPARALSHASHVDEHEWLRTTCMPALASLVRLQARFFTRLAPLLPSLLSLIVSCIDQDIEGLARIGVAGLRMLLAEAGPLFDALTWDAVCTALARLFDVCTPRPLLDARRIMLREEEEVETFSDEDADDAEDAAPQRVQTLYGSGVLLRTREDGAQVVQLPWGIAYLAPSAVSAAAPTAAAVAATPAAAPARAKAPATAAASGARARAVPPPAPSSPSPLPPPELPFNSVRVVTQCVVQLELIAAVGVLADAHMDSLGVAHVHTLLQLLSASADFARRFNADRPLRRALWQSGFMRFAKHNKLPSLLRQETAATQQLLILLLRLYTHTGDAGAAWRALAVSHLQSLSQHMVTRYAQLAVEVERARMLATPAYMHASVQFAPVSAAPAAAGPVAASGGMRSSADLLDGGGAIDRDLFREAAAYGPLVLILLDGVLAFDDGQFKDNLSWLYPLLTGLVVAGNLEIRSKVASVLDSRVRVMLPLAATG